MELLWTQDNLQSPDRIATGKCQSPIKTHFDIIYMDLRFKLIPVFDYIFFDSVDLNYYNTIQTLIQQ